MDNEPQPKWQCKACVELEHRDSDRVWSVLADFFSIHKWLPGLDTSYGIEGVSGTPGCVRYCGRSVGAPDGNGKENMKWATEKLLDIDQSTRSLTYEIIENNLGYSSYRATMEVLPLDDNEKHGCRIEWSFSVDPIEGRTLEQMAGHQESILQAIAKSIEEDHEHEE